MFFLYILSQQIFPLYYIPTVVVVVIVLLLLTTSTTFDLPNIYLEFLKFYKMFTKNIFESRFFLEEITILFIYFFALRRHQ